jgi:DNA-binding winged helix-turn-helix (wHTH) protein
MSLLIVSRTGVYLCAEGGNSCTFWPGPTTDPLELASELRSQRQLEALPVAIVESVDELCGSTDLRDVHCAELSERIRSISEKPEKVKSKPRQFIIDIRGREILSDGVRITCSPAELRLLILFLRYPDVVFSRMALLHRISATANSVDPRMIDVLTGRIRRKIETRRSKPAHLLTVRGLGYLFRHNADIFVDNLTHDRFLSWPVAVTKLS